eukprot:scaffold5517_cov135-Cylindrotheca_fusiformis.AAC.15
MENWMKADVRNVAVVHCLTGRGRSSMVLASFLCWMGESGFANVNDALAYIARCKQIQPNALTIPSQRRYASYFKNILDGVRPSQTPLLLKRIILSEAPKFAVGPQRDSLVQETEQMDIQTNDHILGCAPYLQVFKAGRLMFTTAATLDSNQSEEDLPFVQVCDGTVPFEIGEVIQGDILIRCRHLTRQNQRVSMFRAAFHTGYVPPSVLRLTKTQLDGACSDNRYPDDFFLDLIFEEVDTETAIKHFENQEDVAEDTQRRGGTEPEKGKGPVITASSFDTMLNGDSRVWDVISSRKKDRAMQKNDDLLCGPTVGRRRGERKRKVDQPGHRAATNEEGSSTQIQFSIGNEFDFLPTEAIPTQETPKATPEKDSLMDALNALDQDSDEIVNESVAKSETKEQGKEVSAKTNSAKTVEKEGSADVSIAGSGDDSSNVISSANEEKDIPGPDDDVDDMDALLASVDGDFGDVDLAGFDDDDDLGLDDLEDMLKS